MEEIGDPVEVIARVADSQGCGPIMMGGRNVAADKRAQLGSVSHSILCRPQFSVLAVR